MAVVSAPVNVFAVFQIQPDASLRLMTGELGISGASGLGSGVVVVVSSIGSLQGIPTGLLMLQVKALMDGLLTSGAAGLTTPLPRYVCDMAQASVNTF